MILESVKKISLVDKEKIITRISHYIVQNDKNIISAYIHGSFVYSEDFNDIDIGLFLNKEILKPYEYEVSLEIELEKQVCTPCDVRILNNAPLSFIQNVIRTGKLILDHNPDQRADFESLTLREYFDFQSFRKRYLKETANAVI